MSLARNSSFGSKSPSQTRQSPGGTLGSPPLLPNGELPPPPPMIHLQRVGVDGNATPEVLRSGNTPRSNNNGVSRMSVGSPSKRQETTPGSPTAASPNATTNMSDSQRRARLNDPQGASTLPPTRHLVVDHDVLQKELDALHDDIFALNDDEIPATLREECTDILQEVNRILTLDHIRFVDKEEKMQKRAAEGGVISNGSFATSQVGGSGDGSASPRPLQQPWGGINNAKLSRSWNILVRKVSQRMSVEELSLLSLPTIRDLMHYYNLDNDPVEVANVELYWRALAQQREDERNKKALPHKKCAAAPKNTKGPAREISKQYSPTKKHQQPLGGGGSQAGGSSLAGSFRMSPTGGSFRR